MIARNKTILITGLLTMLSSVAYSNGPKSDLDQANYFVEHYLHSNNYEAQKMQLTKLLKGLHGIELSVYFKTNSAKLDKQGRHQIYQIAKTIWVYPDPAIRLRLDAFTDVRGSQQYNLKLAEKRLGAVQQIFKNALGNRYDKNRFYTGIKGEKSAIYDKNDDEGMSLDRKVTITLFVQSDTKLTTP